MRRRVEVVVLEPRCGRHPRVYAAPGPCPFCETERRQRARLDTGGPDPAWVRSPTLRLI